MRTRHEMAQDAYRFRLYIYTTNTTVLLKLHVVKPGNLRIQGRNGSAFVFLPQIKLVNEFLIGVVRRSIGSYCPTKKNEILDD